jgi:hypothetical protein
VSVTLEFRALAERIVDDLIESDPVAATWLGDHRFDGRLPDLSESAVAGRLVRLDGHITAIDAVDDVELDVADLVDLEILRARLMRARFELDELSRHTWDPMVWNPGTAAHLLVSREFAPAEERAAALRERLRAVPDFLATARMQLDDLSAIHVETAIAQLAGTRHLMDGEVRALAGDDVVVDRAVREVAGFEGWLADRLPEADRSPRLGGRLYAGALWHALDDHTSADVLLRDAEAHLDALTALMADAARQYLGSAAPADDARAIRVALDDIAARATVTDDTVLPLMEAALLRTTAFVRDHDLVGVPDLEIRVIEMPEIHRGVAVAYCDAPGPLETAVLPTFVAVAPTPAGWDAERIASFYREYNAVQLHGLAVHEAMPGHVLQLAHDQRLVTPTRVRRFGKSGVFVEGWAVYAEELMVERGYAPDLLDDRAGAALRLQQLKMQARGAINAMLDIGVHAHDLTERDGLALMLDRGFQEEGEATGKWRRALLTAAQLPTYFAGYRAVSGIVADLRVLHPDWSARRIHDLVLGQGSPAPRHLRTLLGI